MLSDPRVSQMLDNARNASGVRMMMEETTRLILEQEQQEIREQEKKRSELALAAREADESYRACIHALEVREATMQKAVLTELDQVPPSSNDLSASDSKTVKDRWNKLRATHLPTGDKKLPDVVAVFSTVVCLAKNLEVYNGDVDSIFFDDEPQELASSRRRPVTQEKPPPPNLKARTDKAKKDALKKVQMSRMISQFEAQVEREKTEVDVEYTGMIGEGPTHTGEFLGFSGTAKFGFIKPASPAGIGGGSGNIFVHKSNVKVLPGSGELGAGQNVRFRLAPHEAPSSLRSGVGEGGDLSRVQAVEVEMAPVVEAAAVEMQDESEGCPFQTTNPRSLFKHEQEQGHVQICPPATSSQKEKAPTPPPISPPVRPPTPSQPPQTPRKEAPSPKNKTKPPPPPRPMGAPAFGGSSCPKRGCTCGLPHYKPHVGESNGAISRFFGMPLIVGLFWLCIWSHLTLMRTSGRLRRTSVAFITCAYEESDGSGFFGGTCSIVSSKVSKVCSNGTHTRNLTALASLAVHGILKSVSL